MQNAARLRKRKSGGGFRPMPGDRCWRKEATWSSTEWRAGLLRTADGAGIRWRAAAGAWRAMRDMDATWEKNSGTWARAR